MSLTDCKQSDYGKRLRWLNDHLTSCDIQNYIDTPVISIIGSQSTGKSSVLEALSGIAFPRASGTCTRCPTEVRLFKASEDWSCKISLRFDRDAKNNPLEKPSIIKFGPTLTKKEEVQNRIQDAQRAILNPDKDALSFIGSRVEPDQTVRNQVSFSQNTICLEIRGKDLVDLSLVDLPGIIATTGGAEDNESVDVIKQLVKNRISKPGCLILMTITMTDDYLNQICVEFAKDADPKRQRTLGVLTKPDMVQEDDLGEWLKIIEGKNHPLLYGYYVLKNPNSAQLKMQGWSHKHARADEQAYFQKERWQSLNAGTKRKLGSKQLGKQLETLLQKLIQDKLPETIEKIHRMSGETNAELLDLPREVPEAASIQHLHMLLQRISTDITTILGGDKKPEMFALPLKLLAILFRQKIYKSRPVFEPLKREEQEEEEHEDMEEGSLEEQEEGGEDQQENKEEDVVEVEDLFNDEELASDNKAASESKPEDEDGQLHELIKNGNVYKMKVAQYKFDLSTIQSALNNSNLERLPGNICWEIKEVMMKKAVRSLPDFSSNLLKDIMELLKSTIKQVTQQYLQTSYHSPIYRRVTETLLKLIDEESNKCSTILDAINKCEMEHIHSMNEHYYCDKVKIYRERAIGKRQKLKSYPTKETNGINAIDQRQLTCTTTAPNVMNKVAQHDARGTGKEIVQPHIDSSILQQIQIASEIRAYWQVAFKRFTDYVRSIIQVHLIKPVVETCFDRLCETVGIYGTITPAKAHALLREADDVCFKRADLQSRKQRLDKALVYIEKFQSGDFDEM